VTPLQKVVDMLAGMVQKGKEEKHQEQLQFAKYKQFCESVTAEKQRDVQEAEERLELLDAQIQEHNTEAERLASEIVGHEAELTSLANETEVTARVREVESADYLVMRRNYSESLSALTKAISELKRQASAQPAAPELLQELRTLLHGLPASALHGGGRVISTFLARGSEEPSLDFSPPTEATAYEFSSGGILEMLEQLKDKFRQELTELQTEEQHRRHAFTLLAQSLHTAAQAAEAAKASKQAGLVRHKEDSVAAAAERQELAATHADDAAYLQDLTASCEQREQEFHSRQALRSEEIQALEQASELLSSEEVAGTAAKHLPSLLLQPRRAAALVQLRAAREAPSQQRASEYLSSESRRLGSRALSAVALRARGEPLAKVKKLIEELLTRLMSQATAETEHKGWCDQELATNAHTRRSKTQQAEGLRVEIDGLSATSAQLQKELAELEAQLAALDAAVANATAIRSAEQAENANATQEAQAAQQAVAQAVSLLKDFYNKGASATVLSQEASGKRHRQQQEPPAVWDSPYKGMQTGAGNIFAMLEVIQSDFKRLESDTATAEAVAAEAHKKFLEDSQVSKVQKETDVKHKTAERQSKEAALTEERRALQEAEQLLSSTAETYERLKGACLGGGQSYEERVQRREEEIEALKEALEILSAHADS